MKAKLNKNGMINKDIGIVLIEKIKATLPSEYL